MKNEKYIQNLPEWEMKQLKAVRSQKKKKYMQKNYGTKIRDLPVTFSNR